MAFHDDPAVVEALEEREREVLDFEREWWRYAGAKEQAIQERFELSTTRYYQLLNDLIDDDRAVEYDPMLVKRLRRMRIARQAKRAAQRISAER
ncbi:MAG: hypothetical protein ACI867_000123 [Glaciecola sp.]|jgi:hypothetical protein